MRAIFINPKFIVLAVLGMVTVAPLFSAPSHEDSFRSDEIVIWTYDSFVSEWGPAQVVSEAFFKKTGIKAIFVSQGDGGALLAKLLIENSRAAADVILGIDNNLMARAIDSGLFLPYKPSGAEAIPSDLVIDPSFHLTPYDYGYFSIVYDSNRVQVPPVSLEDLTQPRWKSKLILMDPRTSTPGLGFFSWVKAIYGQDWIAYWRRLRPSILTIAEGWDSGYGLFTAGEAPLVLSYTTSPAYHLEYEGTERYKTAIFDQGHIVQIETAGILANSERPDQARSFLDFMLSKEFQAALPITNWMYPVITIALPESFRLAPQPLRVLTNEFVDQVDLNAWAQMMTQSPSL